MSRAGVFIGVDKTGGLQKLNDAAAGARRMYEWALAQGMAERTHAKLITDADHPVQPWDIYNAISEIINGAGVDQLIVYFAGHGVNINRNEVWLLSDAPANTNAAVNVSGSAELAQYGSTGHVVFISDACRVAPEGIQAQNVRGMDVFPNVESDQSVGVDRFYACGLGRTAAELKDPTAAAKTYTALYTNALLDALEGTRPEVLDASTQTGEAAQYVWPEKLDDFLKVEVPRRVKALHLENKVNQRPDAIITSKHKHWLSRIEGSAAPAVSRSGGVVDAGGVVRRITIAPPSISALSTVLLHAAFSNAVQPLEQQLEKIRSARVAGARELASSVEQLKEPFGTDHFESECGIKVRGARLVEVFAPRADVTLFSDPGDTARANRVDPPGASAAVRFDKGFGAVIPLIPGFIAGLTVRDDELIDVTYEPSANSRQWGDFNVAKHDIRALRAIAAAATHHARFRLTAEEAGTVARQMQSLKFLDPTLSVYAAYAYHDLRDLQRIREMSSYLSQFIGVTLFDLALLGRQLVGKAVPPDARILPFIPLLSQGWALLDANRVQLHPLLMNLQSTLRDSLWSLYEPAGVDMIKRALASGDVR